jgi:hypothetical protein
MTAVIVTTATPLPQKLHSYVDKKENLIFLIYKKYLSISPYIRKEALPHI